MRPFSLFYLLWRPMQSINRSVNCINVPIGVPEYNPKTCQHAVFNNRLLNTPLEQTEYDREYKHILNTAIVNGFDKQFVVTKITKFRRLKQIKETTTLSTLNKDVTYKSILTIHGHITNSTKSSNVTT